MLYYNLGVPVIPGGVPAAITGVWHSTEAPDLATMTGGIVATGTWASTETPDSAIILGEVVTSGTWASAEAADQASILGEVAWPAITGTWSSTEATDTAGAAGYLTTTGVWISAEPGDAASMVGQLAWPNITGVWDSAEAADVAAMAGPSLTDQVRAALFGGGEAGGMWDLTDPATLRQLSDGTVTVADGDPIGWAEDLSGNGNHLIQDIALSRPISTPAGAVIDRIDDGISCGGYPWPDGMEIIGALRRRDGGHPYARGIAYMDQYWSSLSQYAACWYEGFEAPSGTATTPGYAEYVNGAATNLTRSDLYNKWPPQEIAIISIRGVPMSGWAGLNLGYYPSFDGFELARRVLVCPTITDPAIRALVEAWLMEGV